MIVWKIDVIHRRAAFKLMRKEQQEKQKNNNVDCICRAKSESSLFKGNETAIVSNNCIEFAKIFYRKTGERKTANKIKYRYKQKKNKKMR